MMAAREHLEQRQPPTLLVRSYAVVHRASVPLGDVYPCQHVVERCERLSFGGHSVPQSACLDVFGSP